MIKEPISRQGHREFHDRYVGTIGFFTTESGKRIPVTIEEVGSSYTIVEDALGNEYRMNNDTGCEIEFTQVPSQWFENNGRIAYITRNPQRQWKRGICTANTSVLVPTKRGMLAAEASIGKITQMMCPSLVADDEDFFTEFQKDACGLFSKYFAWYHEHLYVKNILIGTINSSKKEIVLDNSVFYQELVDTLRRTNKDFNVIVK